MLCNDTDSSGEIRDTGVLQDPEAVLNRSGPGIGVTYFENNGLVGGPINHMLGYVTAYEWNVISHIHIHLWVNMKVYVRGSCDK